MEGSQIERENLVHIHTLIDDTQGEVKLRYQIPKSLCGKSYMENYLQEMGLSLDNFDRIMANDVFLIENLSFKTLGKILCPIKLKNEDSETFWIHTEVHLIDHKMGFVLGDSFCFEYDVMIGVRRITLELENS